MDWSQVLTIAATMLGGSYAFYLITRHQMDRMDDRWEKYTITHREDMKLLDEKWERLFEKLLLKEQNKN